MPVHEPSVPTDIGADSWKVFVVTAVFCGAAVVWGGWAELDAGAVAIGEVIPAGRVRTVQHKDGGIIRQIRVHDGDRVSPGDPLLLLDDTEAKSALELAQQEIRGLEARLADARREASHWQDRKTSLLRLEANAEEESRFNRDLFEKKFISKSRLLQSESQAAQSAATIAENSAELARAMQKVAEAELALAGAQERRILAQERLSRTVVTSPQVGVVSGLRFSTLGGVIPPGGAVLDVVPTSEELVVEARLSPDDIEEVHAGLEARVKLTAYKSRSHISLKGKVTQISGSTFRDDQSQGRPFYKMRVEIPVNELEKIDQGRLTSGMLAQVEIVAGRRTALRYLLDPVIDSMGRAFRES